MTTAFDDDGNRVQTCEPEVYSEPETTEEELDAAIAAFEKLLHWIWQSGMRDPDGVKIRAIVCCWIFLKGCRPMTLTQMATGYGMDKQSLGRWVDEFKVAFPEFKNSHMRQDCD